MTTYNFGSYAFDGSDLISGVAREDLLEQITNLSPYDTPFVSQAPKVGCRHIYHQWLIDNLAAVGTAPNTLTGAVEGADWSLDTLSTPSRIFNVTMILRKDIGLSESQRAVDTAGFADQYAYEVQKATKELAVKLERCVFGALTTATGASGTARVMRGLQAFIATNTAYAGANAGPMGTADSTHDTVVTVGDFNDILNNIYNQGGNPEQVYVSPKLKRQVSAFTVPGAAAGTPHSRNIAAVDKKLIGAIDFYDSDFGLIQIVLDRWVPESTNTTTATASATATGGGMFFLSRAINRLAWLRPVRHELVGKRGDSVAGLVVGEVTLEVLSEKANGWIKGCNNKSAVT
jgi:hypothetical protein